MGSSHSHDYSKGYKVLGLLKRTCLVLFSEKAKNPAFIIFVACQITVVLPPRNLVSIEYLSQVQDQQSSKTRDEMDLNLRLAEIFFKERLQAFCRCAITPKFEIWSSSTRHFMVISTWTYPTMLVL